MKQLRITEIILLFLFAVSSTAVGQINRYYQRTPIRASEPYQIDNFTLRVLELARQREEQRAEEAFKARYSGIYYSPPMLPAKLG
jgi:hypothetical protein